jgi:hypothetical protein
MSTVSLNPDSLLSRVATAEALTEIGYPIKAKTLATMATRGGGPPFRKWPKLAVYKWGDALEWAQARLSGPHPTTSARDVSARDHRSDQNPRPHPRDQAEHMTVAEPARRPAERHDD